MDRIIFFKSSVSIPMNLNMLNMSIQVFEPYLSVFVVEVCHKPSDYLKRICHEAADDRVDLIRNQFSGLHSSHSSG